MKNPLSYQSTEYDCGPTSVINAISFLFERQEIPPDFIKAIMQYCLDLYNENGQPFRCGTSADAMGYMARWFNGYAQAVRFPLHCQHLSGKQVYLNRDSAIYQCLQDGGAAVARCYLTVPHYITLTGIDDKYVHVFDAYYDDTLQTKEGVLKVENMPKVMNRKIAWKVMDDYGTHDYALGDNDFRDVTLFYKLERKEEEK